MSAVLTIEEHAPGVFRGKLVIDGIHRMTVTRSSREACMLRIIEELCCL